jgi:hypothetical protein
MLVPGQVDSVSFCEADSTTLTLDSVMLMLEMLHRPARVGTVTKRMRDERTVPRCESRPAHLLLTNLLTAMCTID